MRELVAFICIDRRLLMNTQWDYCSCTARLSAMQPAYRR